MLLKTKWLPTLFVAIAVAIPGGETAFSDTIAGSYCDVGGENFDFVDIDEVNMSTSAISDPFFGDPEVDGDTLEFDAFGFRGLAAGGDVEFRAGQIKLDIVSRDGKKFDSVKLAEGGSFNLFGGDSTALTSGNGIVRTADGVFDQSYQHQMEGTGNGNWTSSVTIRFPETDRATLILSQQLRTTADELGIAYLETNFLDVAVGLAAAAVPEPGSATLFALLACVPALVRRRIA